MPQIENTEKITSVEEVKEWKKELKKRGINTFQYKVLPEDLKKLGTFQKAAYMKSIKRIGTINGTGLWSIE